MKVISSIIGVSLLAVLSAIGRGYYSLKQMTEQIRSRFKDDTGDYTKFWITLEPEDLPHKVEGISFVWSDINPTHGDDPDKDRLE